MFRRVLIANRGEIAVRIHRTCRALGIETVAIASPVDRHALHARHADAVVHMAGDAPSESYLNIPAIIAAARDQGAQALHPGYGFLAENAELARACAAAGVVWIGPPAEVIERLGSKTEARRLAASAGVPVIQGSAGYRLSSSAAPLEKLSREAERIGYPVLIKAAGGGGGKGMRVVRAPEGLIEACETAAREAQAAFGSDEIFVERYVERPRHVEIQILADQAGGILHLFDRECSIQRRHQKIVEEAPSPALTPELRQAMGEAAIAVARAAGYVNAGTVEFLLDERGEFYFLEVNTRLQVEHPVTEAITGIDLVRAQLLVAAGERLPWSQEDLAMRGCALECRIYAEDPSADFSPSPGTILYLHEPSGPGVRVDSGAVNGSEIPVHYDPIIAKLVTWGESRELARRRMIAALEDYAVLGVETTVSFLHDLLHLESFARGELSTALLDEQMRDWRPAADLLPVALAASVVDRQGARGRAQESAPDRVESPWQRLGEWKV